MSPKFIFVPGIGEQLFLDKYPGATYAIGFEQLKSGAPYNVVRVRRSSDSTEQDFNFNEITDGTLTTFTGPGDGFVVTMYDHTGNGNNFTQTITAEQPYIVRSGIVEFSNGLPAVYNDSNSPAKILNGVNLSNSSGLTVLTVSESDSTVKNQVLFSTRVDNTNRVAIGRQTGFFASRLDNISGLFKNSISNADLNQNILSFETDGANVNDLYKNVSSSDGSSDLSLNASASGTESYLFNNGDILERFGWVGWCNCLIAYESDQSSNRANMVTDLNAIYGTF